MYTPRNAAVAVMAALVFTTSSVFAQTRTTKTDPDTAELAAYRLNIATLQKVIVATQALSQALQTDPRFKELAAAETELKALRAKEGPTEADEKRIEALEKKLEAM